ncbi:MAG: PKD domain-containing protein [Bacteroidota bacterium]
MKSIRIIPLVLIAFLTWNCSDDDDSNLPLADFQFLVDGSQVTFNGTVANANSISWDFGDGSTSSDEDPIYAYADPGTYTVVMTVNGDNGSFSETKEVTIFPTLDILLSGGVGRPEGKTWRLKREVSSADGAGRFQNDLPLDQPSQDNVFRLVGLGSAYDDSFTFVHDGSYRVDNVDGQSIMGLIFASIFFPTEIRVPSNTPDLVPLADVVYEPISDATWSINQEDFTIDSGTGPVTFTGHTQLVLGEYMGYKDSSNVIIIKDITETTMNVAIGIHTVPELFDKPTLFFHLTFESI